MRALRSVVVVFAASLFACTGPTGPSGPSGPSGPAGAPCTVSPSVNGTRTITCADGTTATISDGTNGDAGSSCTVSDDDAGTKTIRCTDGTTAIVRDGAKGDAGSSCSVKANADGSRTVSCTDGTEVTFTPLSSRIDPRDELPGLVLTITGLRGASNADGTFAPGDVPVVAFTVKTRTGAPVMLAELDTLDVWVAGPTSNYQHVLPAARDQLSIADVATWAVQTGPGAWEYTFATPIPATYGVPLFDTPKFSDGELSGPLLSGTYTVAMRAVKQYRVGSKVVPDVGDDTHDFLFSHATTLTSREVVSDANCAQCHERLEAHEGTARGARLCVTCHTAGAEDEGSTATGDATPVTIEFKVMVHKLHSGLHLPSVQGLSVDSTGARVYDAGTPYVVGTRDFSSVLFPAFPDFNIAMPKDTGYSALTSTSRAKEDEVRRGITACEKCHGDPDGQGPLAAPAQGSMHLSLPTRRACGSCHDDVDWSRAYLANGTFMPAQSNDLTCTLCHAVTGGTLPLSTSHRHPLEALDSTRTFAITNLSGGTGPGGTLTAGDVPQVTFTVTDGAGANLPLSALDSFTALLVGPTTNRQAVLPSSSIGTIGASPYDFTGRLAAASTTNKGIMSRVFATGTTLSETLTVDFTSATAFTVTGRTSGVLGSGALPGSPGTFPSGASISSIALTSAAPVGTLVIAFDSPTTFTVTSGTAGLIGTGTLPASTSTSTRFVSANGSVAFNVVIGVTAPAAGNSFYATIVKGTAANPVLFALVGGRTAFSASDRFYYDYAAPAASYTTTVPMDFVLEFLGTGNGTVGQTFTAGNVPVWYGRQTLMEVVGTLGSVSNVVTAAPAWSRFVDVAALDPGWATADYLVLDQGTPNEDYVRVTSIDATRKRIWFTSPLRYAHAVNATVREVSAVYRQEGASNYYTLNPATGQVTLNASIGPTSSLVMSYRSDGRFGWRRKAGDTLQAVFSPPPNDGPTYDESWGDWGGKPLVSGTYTVALWGYSNFDYTEHGELQTYRGAAVATERDFLYGNASTIAPYSIIPAAAACETCHDDLSFHGGGRRGAQTCLLCHAIAGGESGSFVMTGSPAGTPGATINFRTFIHDVHAKTFPASPGGVIVCAKCHGASPNAMTPTDRNHPTAQGMAVRTWQAACVGCHSDTAARAHQNANTAPDGNEACVTCHGVGKALDVATAHKVR